MNNLDMSPLVRKAARNAAVILLIVGLAIGAILGRMTATDNDNDERAYCQGVTEQWHPDYKKIYDKVCKVVDTE